MEKIFFNFNEYAKVIHQNAKDKGFYDKPRNLGETFMLIVSELGEALEAHRKGRFCRIGDWGAWWEVVTENNLFDNSFKELIKDTFEDEIADVIIRILDYVGHRNDINIDIYAYEAQGDFALTHYENIGEILMNINGWICTAYTQCSDPDYYGNSEVETEINVILILLLNLCFGFCEVPELYLLLPVQVVLLKIKHFSIIPMSLCSGYGFCSNLNLRFPLSFFCGFKSCT